MISVYDNSLIWAKNNADRVVGIQEILDSNLDKEDKVTAIEKLIKTSEELVQDYMQDLKLNRSGHVFVDVLL